MVFADRADAGMGASGEDGAQVLNPEVAQARVSQDELAAVMTREQAAVQARAAYQIARAHGRRGSCSPSPLPRPAGQRKSVPTPITAPPQAGWRR